MNKTVKWLLICVVGLAVLSYAGFQLIMYQTKQHSPQDIASFKNDKIDVEVIYSRPYKKGRKIFGGLVPYGEVWRTGANEQTTFETKELLLVDGAHLDPGKYSLFTIPKEQSWKIIFNSKTYEWGADWKTGKPQRDIAYDQLIVEIPVEKNYTPNEQFTITFDMVGQILFMSLTWDEVILKIPLRNAL